MGGTANFDTWLNSDGTENYKCRAWVNFNGTGTVAIRAAGNVSSITDIGVGTYDVNFTNNLVDTDYCPLCTSGDGTANVTLQVMETGIYTVSSFRIYSATQSGAYDSTTQHAAVFR